jgi:signal transduction histidine kinase
MAKEFISQSSLDESIVVGKSSLSLEIRNRLSKSALSTTNKGEVEISLVNEDKKRIIATSGTPMLDVEGVEIGTLHILRDVTEVKALQEQNQRIDRLSAMGEMAVELAHEIRNPLGSIELFASLLAKEVSGAPARWADNIKIGVRTLNTIVFNMLHFANPISPDFSRVDFHSIVREMLSFAEPLMRQRDVQVVTDLASEDPVLIADPELLKQMMLNLIFNAMKAMPSKGSLSIRTRTIHEIAGTQSSKSIEFQIKDTGIGIPSDNLSRIFDPFFTTNKNGTGLGLSIVHQVVQKHSGSIRVESAVNRGTTFTIVFKCASEKE